MSIKCEILPNFDEKIAKKNAKKLLVNYRRIARKVGFVTIDCNRRKVTYHDREDVDFTREENRELLEIRNAMIDALLVLCDNHLIILYYSYFSLNKLTYEKIARKIHYSKGSIEKFKAIAMIEFAEAYQRENLLIGECAE